MNEIRAYLAKIDQKVDEVLRNQDYAEWAKMAGASRVISDAMTMKDVKGKVDALTWSKVQGAPETIAAAQNYALLRLDSLAGRLQSATKLGDLAKMAKEARSEVLDLLAVLARCFELQDAMDVLELDRKLDESPDEVDAHRIGLKAARQNRRENILGTTASLMARIDATASVASSHVLLHMPSHRTAVRSINSVGVAVDDFHRPLGIDSNRRSLETTRWWDAARNPTQLKNAATEAGRVALMGAGVAVLGASVGFAKNSMKGGD